MDVYEMEIEKVRQLPPIISFWFRNVGHRVMTVHLVMTEI